MKLTLWISFAISLTLMGWTFMKENNPPINQRCISTTACDSATVCNTADTSILQGDTAAPVVKTTVRKPEAKSKALPSNTCKPDGKQSCEKKIPASSCDTTEKKPSCSKSVPCDNPCKKS